MIASGFFTQLFQQFVSLLSAFCILPGGVPSDVKSFSTGDGEVTAVAAARDPVPERGDQLLVRIVETQVRGALKIGEAAAVTADRATFVVLEVPRVLTRALDRNGLAGLPGGGADVAAGFVGLAETTAVSLVRLLASLTEDQLDLLAGPRYSEPYLTAAASDYDYGVERAEPVSYLERVIRTQIDGVTDVAQTTLGAARTIGASIMAAPTTIAEYTAKAGWAGLPAGIAAAAREVVYAATDGSIAVIRSVARFARAELALVPGNSIKRGEAEAAKLVEPTPTRFIGPVETLVRIPLAVGVAAADLATAAMRATTAVTGAATRAVVDVVTAARDPKAGVTVAEALARVPETLKNGVDQAGEHLRSGVEQAREDFRQTLRPRRPVEEAAKNGTTLRVSGGAEIKTSTTTGSTTGAGSGTTPGTGDGNEGTEVGGTTGGVDTLSGVEPGSAPEPGTDPGAGEGAGAGAGAGSNTGEANDSAAAA